MNCIDLMVEEHKNIKRMLAVIRQYCIKILNGDEVRYEDFYDIIDFVRSYADKYHHGKEETMLFAKMVEELGPTAEKLVKYGMHTEHDLGRFYMQELEMAVNKVISGALEARLDVIANAISYTHLLNRHIDKEDNVVYKFAENNLTENSKNNIEEECRLFEQKASEDKTKEKYLDLLFDFEKKLNLQ